MADASFDVVVIGGGHQGLSIGTYLAMNGMTVGLFEQRHELGGGCATEPRPAAGFLGNTHAHIAGFWGSPMMQDFKLGEKGLDFVFPKVLASMITPDEKALVTYMSMEWDPEKFVVTPKPEMIERNLKEIARISPSDAERLAGLLPKIEKWSDANVLTMHNPPPLPGERDYMAEFFADPDTGIDGKLQWMTCMELVRYLYDHPILQAYALRQMASEGFYPDQIPPACLALTRPLHMLGLTGMAVFGGGTHTVAHALQRALSEQGGKFYVGADVDEILIQNGRATGIKLADGTKIHAKKFVVTSLEVKQTFNRHLRNITIHPNIRRKVDQVRYDNGAIFWGQIAMHELADYPAKAWNPDCGKGRWVFFNDPDIEYLCHEYHYRNTHIKPGNWPEKLYLWEATDSQFDPRWAPEGKHVALLEECAPQASRLSEREWTQLRKEAPVRFLEEWRKYAPNMTEKNVIASHIDTPWDVSQRNSNMPDGCQFVTSHCASQWGQFRPFAELAQYQYKDIENLWMACGSMHFSWGVMGWASYNCYKRMAKKYGLRKFWEEANRRY